MSLVSDILPLVATHAANWTNTSTFNCVGMHRLPFHGTEILIVSLVYLAMIAMYCVTFIDVAIKQTWPETMLDKEVLKRVRKLKEDFPGIAGIASRGSKGSTGAPIVVPKNDGADIDDVLALNDWDPVAKVEDSHGAVGTVHYDQVISTEPYAATCCVDEDLTFMLANGDAFSTVSSYCSSTVRGYAMLSTMLPMSGAFLGFMWIHNAMINPIGDNYARYGGIIGYFLVFLTGIVMCGPNSNTVHRNRNILLWDSVETNSWVLKAHGIGIGGFCLVPLLCNLWQVVFTTDVELPNRHQMWVGIILQVFGLLLFVSPKLFAKGNCITALQAKQIGIIGEIIGVMASMITFVQIESYSSAACAQMVETYDYTMVGAMIGTLAVFCVKTYNGAPTGTYTNNPSVMLMNHGTPVATSGPVPVLNYNREAAILPIVQPQQ